MAKPVDVVTLDPKTRRLADRGAREAFGVSLDRFVDDLTTIAGDTFDTQALETLVLAGELAERAGLPEPAIPPDCSLTPARVDIATLDAETRRLADRGSREVFGYSLDRLVSHLSAAGEMLDQQELDGLVLAGKMAEEIDHREASGAPSPEKPGNSK